MKASSDTMDKGVPVTQSVVTESLSAQMKSATTETKSTSTVVISTARLKKAIIILELHGLAHP